MLEIRKLANGAPMLTETLGQPTVYLDNWALNKIATSNTRRHRFVSAMMNKAGTLRISISTIVELLKQTDRSQIKQIFHMIDAVDTGLINIDFEDVIQQENKLFISAGDSHDPSQELTVIHDFLMAQEWPEIWSVSDVAKHILKNSDNRAFEQSFESFAARMEAFLSAHRADPDYMKKSRSRSHSERHKKSKYCIATRELKTRSFDFILQNQNMKMPGKEWHDLFHTIVPVAYCDIVFLDRRWADFVSQSGLKPPEIATVFTDRSLDTGIAAIEEHKPSVDP